MSIGQTPNATEFHRTRPKDVREKRYNLFTPFSIWAPQGDLLGQSSQVSVLMYSKTRTTNLPNFVPFWQLVYEISAVELLWFRWKRGRQTWPTKTVNDMSPYTMWRQWYTSTESLQRSFTATTTLWTSKKSRTTAHNHQQRCSDASRRPASAAGSRPRPSWFTRLPWSRPRYTVKDR